jgi:hypothetical protein
VTIDRRGGRESTALEAARDADAFARCRRRLDGAIRGSCAPEQVWPARVAGGIGAAFEFADADPVAARILTVHAAVRRSEGGLAFAAMVEHFAALLEEGAPSTRRPSATPRGVVIRIARQMFHRLEAGGEGKMAGIAPDLIVFALTPYLGFGEAQHWASAPRTS